MARQPLAHALWAVALVVLSLGSTVEAARTRLCNVYASSLDETYGDGVDISFFCQANSGTNADVRVRRLDTNAFVCGNQRTTSPFGGCRNKLGYNTNYWYSVFGSPGYDRYDFYTPGDCMITRWSINCQTSEVYFACSQGSTVVLEVQDEMFNRRIDPPLVSVTSPFRINPDYADDFFLADTDHVSISGIKDSPDRTAGRYVINTITFGCDQPPSLWVEETPVVTPDAPTPTPAMEVTVGAVNPGEWHNSLCHVQGSWVDKVYLHGVDFGFMCWPNTGNNSNVKISLRDGTIQFCSQKNVTDNMYRGCNGDNGDGPLWAGTEYRGESWGLPGYSRTDFFTPGECVLIEAEIKCVDRLVYFTCVGSSLDAVVAIVGASGEYKHIALNVTSPYTIPDGILTDTDVVTVNGASLDGQFATVSVNCSTQMAPTPLYDPLPNVPTAVPDPAATPLRTRRPTAGGQSGGGAGKGVATPTPDSGVPPDGSALGDPHVTTLDGVTITYLSCGDNTMIKAGDFLYQARHCSYKGEGSSTCGVAVKCSAATDVIEVYADAPKVTVLIGRQERDVTRPVTLRVPGATVVRTARYLEVHCRHNGFRLLALIHESLKFMYLDTMVWAPEEMRGKTAGLMGAWDGDMQNDVQFADGEVFQFEQGATFLSAVDYPDLNEVQKSWIVQKEDSLFSRDGNPERRCDTDRRRLNALQRTKDATERLHATEYCEQLGLTAGLLRMCVFDFIATKDEVFAANILDSKPFLLQ